MTNEQVRRWYQQQVAIIPRLNQRWIADRIDVAERARRAWKMRHDARLRARQLMDNEMEVKLLQGRDLKLYGNPDGPTFEFLIDEGRKQGLDNDRIYESIIAGSFITNRDVDKGFE